MGTIQKLYSSYKYDTTLFLLLLIDIVACDLYFVLIHISVSWIFPPCLQVTSLAADVRAPYLCALPSATYLSAIGQILPATAAAYPCDCDPLDHHSHDSPGIHTIGCLPYIYQELHHTALRTL